MVPSLQERPRAVARIGKLTTLLIVSLVCGMITSSTSCAAGRLPADTDPIAVALKRAATFWHNVPCRGHIAVVSEEMERPYTMAYTTWDSPTGEVDNTSSPSTYTDCVIHISRAWWPNWLEDDAHFSELCQMMAHEFSHLEGYSDTDIALTGTVMGPSAIENAPLIPACRRYRLVYRIPGGIEWFTG